MSVRKCNLYFCIMKKCHIVRQKKVQDPVTSVSDLKEGSDLKKLLILIGNTLYVLL